MPERTSAIGRPPAIGSARRWAGRVMARLHGYADGFSRSGDRAASEVYRYKERGEEAARAAAAWWAESRQLLEGECAALRARLAGSDSAERRLLAETKDLRSKADGVDGEFRHEALLREREQQLGLSRRTHDDLTDRLQRLEAQLDGAYHIARTSAEGLKDYYEGLMYTYCAANRHAPAPERLPAIELPQSLSATDRPRA